MQYFGPPFLVISVILAGFSDIKCASGRSPECHKLQWRCDNGQCIAAEDLCDGVRNCTDGSDETVEHCIHLSCPAYAFRCAYGACIQGNFRCNKIEDCWDGSDETKFLCDRSLGVKEKENILRGDCPKDLEMECQKGECIERDKVCDGKLDCSNGKDEAVEFCSSVHCSKYAFRCGNGACIPGKKKCDGVRDCFDGADEAFELCNETESPEYCFIPVERKNLGIKNLTGNRELKPGDRVLYGTRLKFVCPKGWNLVGAMRSVCESGGWSNQIPHCSKYCSSYILHRSLSTIGTCSYNDNIGNCRGLLLPGTVVEMSCAPGYVLSAEIGSSSGKIIRCNESGEWSSPKLQCQPRCGHANDGSTAMPWDVSIFRWTGSYQFQCYGTILSPKIVVSVQTCFSKIRFADVDEHEKYNIITGNYSRSYERFEVPDRPVFNVSEIYMHYTPDSSENLAVLVLVKFFVFSDTLVPICLQFKTFTTSPYARLSENSQKNTRPAELGTSISQTKMRGNKMIHFLVAIWDLTYSDSRLNPFNIVSLEDVIRKFIERYQNIY